MFSEFAAVASFLQETKDGIVCLGQILLNHPDVHHRIHTIGDLLKRATVTFRLGQLVTFRFCPRSGSKNFNQTVTPHDEAMTVMEFVQNYGPLCFQVVDHLAAPVEGAPAEDAPDEPQRKRRRWDQNGDQNAIVQETIKDLQAVADKCTKAGASDDATTCTIGATMLGTIEDMRLKAEAKNREMRTIQTEPPNAFTCPITQGLIRDAVVCADGHSYSETDIEMWLELNNTSPLTNLTLEDQRLIPNHALRKAIGEWQEWQKQQQQQ